MNKLVSLILLTAVVLACQTKKEESHEHTTQQVAPADTIKKSIPKEEHAMLGKAHITILYHAPAVRGRTIWGGLVPFDEVWVTGAHRATSLEVSHDFSLNGNNIPAGKYALFTIPGKETWTVIINKKWDQHLADDYSPQDDVARFTVTPEVLSTVQERLNYTVESETEEKGRLLISWEKIRLAISFEVK